MNSMTKLETIAPGLPPQLTLEAGEAHVWCCSMARIGDLGRFEALRPILDPQERQRLERLRGGPTYRQSLLGRILRRHLLSLYASAEPADWRFATNAYGKPMIVAPHQGRRLVFNLAHTTTLLMMAIGHVESVGVDVENVQRQIDGLSIAQRYFHECEAAALESLAPPERGAHFHRLWTVKECYLKARGLGLSLPLDSIGIGEFEEGTFSYAIVQTHGGEPTRWHIEAIEHPEGWVGAICIEHESSMHMPRVSYLDLDPFRRVAALACRRWQGVSMGR